MSKGEEYLICYLVFSVKGNFYHLAFSLKQPPPNQTPLSSTKNSSTEKRLRERKKKLGRIILTEGVSRQQLSASAASEEIMYSLVFFSSTSHTKNYQPRCRKEAVLYLINMALLTTIHFNVRLLCLIYHSEESET